MATPPGADPAELFESFRGDVYLWGRRLLGSHHDALDLVQDVFLRWFEQVRRSKPRNPRGWLRRATVNRAIDLIRSRERKALPAGGGAVAAPAGPMKACERMELRRDIVAGLQRLTDIQRAVLVAKEYDGMTFAQIGAEMDKAVTTVKTHYLRAVAGLRSHLAGRWKPERDGA